MLCAWHSNGRSITAVPEAPEHRGREGDRERFSHELDTVSLKRFDAAE
jgi:hypothetical protein